MTRSFTSMLLGLQFLAGRRARNEGFIGESRQEWRNNLRRGFARLRTQWSRSSRRRSFADYVFLAQGPFYGIAREASLKVMEMSCSYSQFFHALEFRHGPKAIVSPDTCLMFFLSETGRDAEMQVLAEMKELGGATIAVCNRADDAIRGASDLVMEDRLRRKRAGVAGSLHCRRAAAGPLHRRAKGTRCGPSEKSDARCDSRLSFSGDQTLAIVRRQRDRRAESRFNFVRPAARAAAGARASGDGPQYHAGKFLGYFCSQPRRARKQSRLQLGNRQRSIR